MGPKHATYLTPWFKR